MNEVISQISCSIYVSDEVLQQYTDESGDIDLKDLVTDSISLEENGEFMVDDAYIL